MAWIESHQELAFHPKTKRLARALQVSIPTAIGHLHLLWWWALDYAEDGDLTKYDVEDIADALMWERDAKEIIDALEYARFIRRDGDRLIIHDWEVYAGRLLEQRRRNAERRRSSRGRRAPAARGTSICRGATVPNQTVPNQTEHKEKRETTSSDGPENIPDATETERDILNTLKSVPNYPFEYQRDLDHIRALAVDYPALNLVGEIKKWRTYKLDKPLKPKSNPRSQLRNWCEKAVEYSRSRASPHKSQTDADPWEGDKYAHLVRT